MAKGLDLVFGFVFTIVLMRACVRWHSLLSTYRASVVSGVVVISPPNGPKDGIGIDVRASGLFLAASPNSAVMMGGTDGTRAYGCRIHQHTFNAQNQHTQTHTRCRRERDTMLTDLCAVRTRSSGRGWVANPLS